MDKEPTLKFRRTLKKLPRKAPRPQPNIAIWLGKPGMVIWFSSTAQGWGAIRAAGSGHTQYFRQPDLK